LIDLYSLFYLKYIHGNVSKIKNQWQSIRNEGSFGAWSGYAYENVWMLHMPQLLKALEIAGTSIEATSWKYRGDANMPGAQIDLLVERGDDVIHICEVKFSKNEFVITKSYSKDLMRKRTVFEYATKTKKLIVTTLLTTYPAVQNLYYQDQVHSEATNISKTTELLVRCVFQIFNHLNEIGSRTIIDFDPAVWHHNDHVA